MSDRKRLASIVCVTVVLTSLLSGARAADTTLYVSPAGDDAANGATPEMDASSKKSGPFRTLGRAREAIRTLKTSSGGKLPGPVVVRLRGGAYFLAEPFILTPEDGGSAESPITYAAQEGETPVVSGGFPVSGWQAKAVNGKPAWVAAVPERATVPGAPREMWVNGACRTLARLPNEGYLHVASVDEPNHPQGKGHTDFRFKPGDLKAWPTATDSIAVVFNRWAESHLPVTRIDEAGSQIFFSKVSLHALQPDDPYFLEGAADFLDQPGEWCYDRKTSTVTYLPLPGEEMSKTQAVLPNLTRVMNIAGLPDKKQFVEHIKFRGVTFSHSEFNLESPGGPGNRSGYSQAAVGIPGVVEAVGARHCAFENCTFADAGNYGLVLGMGAQDNVVSRCTFTRLGAGGVRIGEIRTRQNPDERAMRNEVSDTRIFDCGLLYASCVGLWIGQAADNRIHHNEIFDLPYTGISTGWTWGYAETQCSGNIVEHNHVHHIGARSGGREVVLSDMGGIYTLGHQPGAVIRFNRFHDIAGLRYGGWGIYFDEGSRDIVAEQNVVYRTTHGGFHQHYGQDNIFRNNIIALGRDNQVIRTRAEDHKSFTFERNIVYWEKGDPVMGQWTNFNAAFDNNVYWRTTGNQDFKIGYLTRDLWRQKGLDVHSLFADPKFIDPAKDDFSLQADSPALKLGFKTWDQSDVGPRKAR